MSSFSPFERAISTFLARSPSVRAKLKNIYQRLNFLLYGERGFRLWLADGIRIATPSTIIGADEPDPQTAEFFGYFDASPWSANGRHYVVNQTKDIETSTDIVLYDLEAKTRERVGSSPVATWQQGTMCRWLAHDDHEYLAYNTVRANVLGTRLFSPTTRQERFLPLPLQAINEKHGKLYAINYLRLYRNGTEYGYYTPCTNLSVDTPDDKDGIWSVDLDSENAGLIVSLEQLRGLDPTPQLRSAASHEVNHLSVAPDGRHFVFVHRFRGSKGQLSRLYACKYDGSNLRLLLDEQMVSHYAWLDSEHLIAWARTHAHGDRYYLVNSRSGATKPFPADESINQWGDGHPSHHHTSGHIVTDSYPDRKRQQHLFLIIHGNHSQEIARFLLPLQFSSADRIDLHPRWRPDGKTLSIDSGYTGVRRNYLLDVSSITTTAPGTDWRNHG